jgi:cell division septation protein DedD
MMDERQNDGLDFEPIERLPWLEPVDDTPQDQNSILKLIGLVIAGLIGIGIIVGGLWYWQNADANGKGDLIAAPDDPYKVAPKAEPGRFDGDGNVAVAAAEGVQPVGTVDADRLPEQPVPPPAAKAAPAGPAAAAKAPVATKAAPPAAATRTVASAATPATATAAPTGGGTVQLGAFASEATAARAWDGLKARFEWLQPVNRSIVAAEVGGRTVYRLRAAAGTNDAARTLCNRLRVAGENCIVLP